MKKIKDIFYDMNDILVALVIVALAAFVIVGNIDSILAYPSSIAEEIQVPEDKPATNYAENPQGETQNQGSADTTDGAIDNPGTEEQGSSDQQGSGDVANYSIYIESGATGEKIADLLIEVGLLKTRQEFYNAVAIAGAEKKLQAGNFIIPSNATPAEVISIITN